MQTPRNKKNLRHAGFCDRDGIVNEEKLHELKKDGAISQEEFDKKKEELLNRI